MDYVQNRPQLWVGCVPVYMYPSSEIIPEEESEEKTSTRILQVGVVYLTYTNATHGNCAVG